MWRSIRKVALIGVAVVAMPSLAIGQPQARPESGPNPPVFSTNVLLEASLNRIFRGSVSWREAIEAVRKTGRRVLVVTPDDPIVDAGNNENDHDTFDPAGLAEVVPALGKDAQLRFVLVIVNLPLVQRMHDSIMSTPWDLEADLDRILIHEVYGHAIPYLLAGSLSGRCADPKPGERPADACSIRRENAVRAELGLGLRTDRGLSSLSLARGRSF